MSAEQILKALTDNIEIRCECSCELINIEFKSFVTCNINRNQFFKRQDVNDIIANNSLIDPCNPSKSSEEILRDFANKNCSKDLSGKPWDAILSDIVEKGTVIWTSANLLQYCPLYDCLWKNMLSGNRLETNLVCNLISPFEGSNNFKNIIIIQATDFSKEQNPNALAKTDIQSGNIYILINKNRCTNRDTLEMFETIQHELIHATLLNELMNYFGFDGDKLGNNSYYEAYEKYVAYYYGTNASTNEHKEMLEKYLKVMVENLIEVTGIGTYADYEGLVLNGFPLEILESCSYNLWNIEDKLHNYNVFKYNNPFVCDKIKEICQ